MSWKKKIVPLERLFSIFHRLDVNRLLTFWRHLFKKKESYLPVNRQAMSSRSSRLRASRGKKPEAVRAAEKITWQSVALLGSASSTDATSKCPEGPENVEAVDGVTAMMTSRDGISERWGRQGRRRGAGQKKTREKT